MSGTWTKIHMNEDLEPCGPCLTSTTVHPNCHFALCKLISETHRSSDSDLRLALHEQLLRSEGFDPALSKSLSGCISLEDGCGLLPLFDFLYHSVTVCDPNQLSMQLVVVLVVVLQQLLPPWSRRQGEQSHCDKKVICL